jgi:hypothetical protein
MKNTFRLFWIFAIVVAIGFLVVGCEIDNNDYEMLNGVWDRGDIVVTFNDGNGIFTQINSNSNWQTVRNYGYVNIGDRKFRNIDKNGDLKWTCQELVHDTSTYVTSWEDCTLTMSANGQTLYTAAASAGSDSYTKK